MCLNFSLLLMFTLFSLPSFSCFTSGVFFESCLQTDDELDYQFFVYTFLVSFLFLFMDNPFVLCVTRMSNVIVNNKSAAECLFVWIWLFKREIKDIFNHPWTPCHRVAVL